MMVTVMEMMMMIPMKSGVMTMAMISPLWEGISPADFCLPESFFSLCGFRLVEAAEYFLDGPPRLRVYGGLSTRRGASEVGQGGHTMPRRGRRGPAPWGGVGPSWPISASPFGWLRHLTK